MAINDATKFRDLKQGDIWIKNIFDNQSFIHQKKEIGGHIVKAVNFTIDNIPFWHILVRKNLRSRDF